MGIYIEIEAFLSAGLEEHRRYIPTSHIALLDNSLLHNRSLTLVSIYHTQNRYNYILRHTSFPTLIR